MINRDFIFAISEKFSVGSADLVEKDLLLQQLLQMYLREETFSQDYAFKGGTCLIKCYLGYFRFSEDLDFTYLKQDTFVGKSANEIKRLVSPLIEKFLRVTEAISGRLDLNFKAEKSNSRCVQHGGNERMLTLRIWYKSEILGAESFIKVQISFAEVICFPIETKKIRYWSVALDDDEIRTLFPREYQIFSIELEIKSYSLEEIACEKMRAILTRKGVKVRDYVDLYFLKQHIKGGFGKLKQAAELKTRFAVHLFTKYQNNLKSRMDVLSSMSLPDWTGDRTMLLTTIDEREFESFVVEMNKLLANLMSD